MTELMLSNHKTLNLISALNISIKNKGRPAAPGIISHLASSWSFYYRTGSPRSQLFPYEIKKCELLCIRFS